MESDRPDIDMRDAWRQQPREEPMTLGNIQARAGKFDTRMRGQNRLTAIAIAVVVIGNAIQLSGMVSLMTRVGTGLILLAVVFVMYRYGRVRGTGPMPVDLGVQQSLAFYRAQIVRHRDAVKNFWWEYALPFVPGIVLSLAGRATERPRSPMEYALLVVVFALVIGGIRWFNTREASRLQAEIDELDRAM